MEELNTNSIEELNTNKLSLKILHSYNEINSKTGYVYFSDIQFLGLEYIDKNPCLRFQRTKGIQFRRQVNDNDLTYEHIVKDTDKDTYTDDEIKSINFIELPEKINV